MINCEENCCENYQLAVCLHCMRRLCLSHIENHQEILFNEIDELQNEVNQINVHLMNGSNTIIKERQAEEKKWNEWYQRKMVDIEREYNRMIISIQNRHKTLEQLQIELNQRLKVEIQQPLEQISIQKSINPHSIDVIRSAIETIKQERISFTWKPQKLSTLGKGKRSKNKKIIEWKPGNLLFPLFRDVSRASTDKIKEFVQTMKNENSMEKSGLIILVFSYLQTWHQTKIERGKYKELILNKHILTIKEYIIGNNSQRKVLIAMEFFFYKLKQQEQTEIEMMTRLLQIFFDHQCISISQMMDWYFNDHFLNDNFGIKIEKKWAEPFLSQHGCQIKSLDSPSNEPTAPHSKKRYVRIRKPFNNLVKLFKNQSNKNDQAIDDYIKIQCGRKENFRVIMIIRSYLKGWNESLLEKKNELLFNYLSVIEFYKSDPDFEMQILFAIEIFLSQNKKNENSSIETISTLFQFFLEQNLIEKGTFLQWDTDGHYYEDVYYEETKRFAQSFIQQLIRSNEMSKEK